MVGTKGPLLLQLLLFLLLRADFAKNCGFSLFLLDISAIMMYNI